MQKQQENQLIYFSWYIYDSQDCFASLVGVCSHPESWNFRNANMKNKFPFSAFTEANERWKFLNCLQRRNITLLCCQLQLYAKWQVL
jgi:hypothetical protein